MMVDMQRFAAILFVVVFGLLFVGCGPRPLEDLGEPYGDPMRFEKHISRFEKLDQQSQPPTGAVVCVGSSSIRMWHKRIVGDLAPLTVVPRGFGGSNMNDLLHYADRVVLAYRPRAVLIYEGDNDIGQGISPQRIALTFDELVGKIHLELPACRIYVLSIKPSLRRWSLWPKMVKANQLLEQACERDGRLTFIDVASPMLGSDGKPRPELFIRDELHLNEAGYDLWRGVVRPVLVEREKDYE